MTKYSLLNTKANDPTTAVFGTDSEGNAFIADLSEGPHWIVAGASGSGKSVYMNNLLCSIMYHSSPKELEIFAIDPKMVEFASYADLPFCPIPPVINMNDAYGLLAYLVWLMDDRYTYLKDLGVKNIKEYNAIFDNVDKWITDTQYRLEHLEDEVLNDKKGETLKQRKEKLDRYLKRCLNNKKIIEGNPKYQRMTYIVTVIDEYADLVMVVKDIEELIVRLAQKARASGITLLIATQRPSANILSPTIKANVPARIGLKTTDSVNSNIIIDENGLEKLRSKGESIVKLPDGSLTRVKGPYIRDEELKEILAYLKSEHDPPKPLDYKTKVVELGILEWEEDYSDDVPMEERHVVKPKRTPW